MDIKKDIKNAITNYFVLRLTYIVTKESYTYMSDISPSYVNPNVLRRFARSIFNNQELQQRHNPYDQELREMDSIEQGDHARLQECLAESYAADQMLGRLAESELRNIKNLAIVNVTLASRAAIRAGVVPEIAFTFSDAYIQEIETLQTISEVRELILQCKSHYASLAAEARESRPNPQEHIAHSKITQCKNYIISHLHDKIRVQEIADHLHTSPTYLADLFREHEGMTITSFILQEKIKLVKNMLIYSPYSYSAIAAYLGFSSQSHLGNLFKKQTGYTLRQYRERFGVKEFQEN